LVSLVEGDSEYPPIVQANAATALGSLASLDEAFGDVSKLRVLGHLLRYLQSPHSRDLSAAVLLGLTAAARNWKVAVDLSSDHVANLLREQASALQPLAKAVLDTSAATLQAHRGLDVLPPIKRGEPAAT
jgi:hypothetical protein